MYLMVLIWEYQQNISWKIKHAVIFIQTSLGLVLSKSFDKTIHDIARKYDNLNVSDLRKLVKLHIKWNRGETDINFLKNYKCFGVFPKFLRFQLPNVDNRDIFGTCEKLLKSTLNKRMREKRDIEKNIKYLLKQIKGTLNNIDWYLVTKCLQSNVVRHEKQNLKTHEKSWGT